MNSALLRLYQHLPPSLRSFAVSLWGFQLRRWRYGPETERLVNEALQREHWTAIQWKKWREEKVSYILHRAATRVPFYRALWEERRRRGDTASWEYLENWPILSKEALREHPEALVADDRTVKRMFCDYTSGTTGTPLKVWQSRQTLHAWHALFEARIRGWHGIGRNSNWATLGGKPVVPLNTQSPPFWVWNAPMKQLYLSSNHVSRANTPAFVAALRKYSITHLVAYPSLASILAYEAVRLGLDVPRTTIITIAEPLTAERRKLVAETFGPLVRETYGMTEIAAQASECPSGKLHIWPEVGFIEFLTDSEDVPVADGTAGRMICTSLLNEDMPLVRYAVGDRGIRAGEGDPCVCGRTLPLLSGIEGRTYDLLIATDGRKVYMSMAPIVHNLAIREAQVIQESLNELKFRYVPGRDFIKDGEQLIIQRLRERMGNIHISIEALDQVPRENNGKFRAVLCKVPLQN